MSRAKDCAKLGGGMVMSAARLRTDPWFAASVVFPALVLSCFATQGWVMPWQEPNGRDVVHAGDGRRAP